MIWDMAAQIEQEDFIVFSFRPKYSKEEVTKYARNSMLSENKPFALGERVHLAAGDRKESTNGR